jgi:hypothetical protein
VTSGVSPARCSVFSTPLAPESPRALGEHKSEETLLLISVLPELCLGENTKNDTQSKSLGTVPQEQTL